MRRRRCRATVLTCILLSSMVLPSACVPASAQVDPGAVPHESPDSPPRPTISEWLRLPCTDLPAARATQILDHASLHVDSQARPESVLSDLADMLRSVAARDQDGNVSINGSLAGEISASLALFPWRFGSDPREQPGWGALLEEARRMLADVEADPARLPLDEEDSSEELIRILLLDVAGRSNEAATRLERVQVHHYCGNCAAARQAAVERRRSEMAERRGDLGEALERALAAIEGDSYMGRHLGTDAEATRLGMLLLQLGRSDEGLCVLQQVVDLSPGTAGAEVARAVLSRSGALRDPTRERLQAVYVDGLGRWDSRRPVAEFLARPPEPDLSSFERLVADARFGDLEAVRRLAALGDVRGREVFVELLERGQRVNLVWEAALGLHALGEGDMPIRSALVRLAEEPDLGGWMASRDLDLSAREVLGDGPRPDALPATLREAASAWLAWLDQRSGG